MIRWLSLLLVVTATIGCTSLVPSSRSGTGTPGEVDWSCGRYMPTVDSTEWSLMYSNELFPGRTKISTRKVRSLESLRPHGLDLTGCELAEGVLNAIANLATLEKLCLAATTGDEGSMASLAKLKLKTLDLSGTAVDDADLAALAQISTLRKLKLNYTKISDAGLRSLAALPALERLEVCDTAVSAREVEAFREGRPKVTVVDVVDARVTGGVF